MSRCPITYEELKGGKYSLKGLRKLSPKLKFLNVFPYSADDQVREAIARAAKMSIQGVQPKLSVRLNVRNETFEIVDTGGRYILKPQTQNFREVPENEDATFSISQYCSINIRAGFSRDHYLLEVCYQKFSYLSYLTKTKDDQHEPCKQRIAQELITDGLEKENRIFFERFSSVDF